MGDYKKILVALDFSTPSIGALSLALDLATKLDAKPVAVHTVSLTEIQLPESGSAVLNDELIHAQMSAAEQELNGFIKQHAQGSGPVEQHVCLGEPSEEINRLADANGVDMIVIGTHGRTGIKHLLMGSVAEGVIRHATVPVLCLRAPD